MAKYLYGAAVQGIQGFIFQTNELKDIVGASELVEEICKKDGLFEEFGKYENSILRAAGNIKHIFDDEESCRNAVLNFPKRVMEKAPGITVSQAVVKMDDVFVSFENAVAELENKLRTQRNRQMPSVTCGLMGIKRSNNSGLPAVNVSKEDGKEVYQDASARAKKSYGDVIEFCKTAFGKDSLSPKQVAFNIEDITDRNDWIAIIHADGNGLGQIVQKIGKNKEQFKEFSKKLDEATKNAAVAAYREIVECALSDERRIPVRPIVLGGDDFTVICRADFAVEYVTEFMKQFEEQTRKLLGQKFLIANNVFKQNEDKLTACAGVAFIKSSYPFYYGYELAESLCTEAKKVAKSDAKDRGTNLPYSCLMFHKVQDSFVEEYKEIEKRELTPQEGITFKFGPYYVNEKPEKSWTIEELVEKVRNLNSIEGNRVKSHIRQWMSELHNGQAKAEQKANRVASLLQGNMKKLFEEITLCNDEDANDKDVKSFPAYDLLSLASVKFQETKSKKED